MVRNFEENLGLKRVSVKLDRREAVPRTQYLPRFAGELDRRERSDRWSGGGSPRHARSLRLTPPGSRSPTSPFRGGTPRLSLDNRKLVSISAGRALGRGLSSPQHLQCWHGRPRTRGEAAARRAILGADRILIGSPGVDSNHRPDGKQPSALPTELPGNTPRHCAHLFEKTQQGRQFRVINWLTQPAPLRAGAPWRSRISTESRSAAARSAPLPRWARNFAPRRARHASSVSVESDRR